MASKNASSSSKHPQIPQGRTCLCAPTTHPGSFRCSLHRSFHHRVPSRSMAAASRKWELTVTAKANSFKVLLLQIIKPSSHDLRRKRNFQPRPTRFSLMNGSRDGVAVS